MWASRWLMSKPHSTARSTWARHSRRTSSRSAWSQTSVTVRGKPPSPSRRDGRLGDRAPAVEVVLGVEGQADADVVAPEPRRGLAGPGGRHQQRGRRGDAVAQGVVDAGRGRVAEAEVGTVEDQEAGIGCCPEPLGHGRHAPTVVAGRSGGATRRRRPAGRARRGGDARGVRPRRVCSSRRQSRSSVDRRRRVGGCDLVRIDVEEWELGLEPTHAGLGVLAHGSSVPEGCNTGAMTEADAPIETTAAPPTGVRRYGITVPFDGVPMTEHRRWYEDLARLGYTDVWSAETDGLDGFTPLALAAAWTPASCSSGWPSSPPTPGDRRCWPRAWPPWPRRRPGTSPSGWAPPRT